MKRGKRAEVIASGGPHLQDDPRTCCGCGLSWIIPACPVKIDPPYSCGKPDCNKVKRTMEKSDG